VAVKVAYLELLTFKEGSWGAKHYYATLRIGDERIELDYELNVEQATDMSDSFYTWDAGDRTGRFFSKEDTYKACVPILRQHPEVVLLLKGSPATAQPMYAIGGDPKLVEVANRLYALQVQIDRFDYDPKRSDALYEKWNALIKPLEAE